jgi:hypothetical protein
MTLMQRPEAEKVHLADQPSAKQGAPACASGKSFPAPAIESAGRPGPAARAGHHPTLK